MKTFRFFALLFLSLFTFLPGMAQKIWISGQGKGYSNSEIRVFRISDPVTKSHIPVATMVCDTSGRFSFSYDSRPPETIVLRTGIYYLALYVDEAKDMKLLLPDFEARNEEDRQNSFFEETKMVPEVVSDTENVNNYIRKFDLVYDPLFNRVADRIMYNTKKKDIPSLIEQLNSFSATGTPFFKSYVRFRLMMLNQVASGEYQGRKEDSVLVNQYFHPENRAYSELIEQMFNKYFRSLSSGNLKSQFNSAFISGSPVKMKEVIKKDGKAVNDQLEEYIILVNLFNEYFDSWLQHDKIIEMLNLLRISGSSDYIRKLADSIIIKLNALNDGSVPPGLTLKDESGKMFSLDQLNGKYVILTFATSDNAFSVAEYSILRGWYDKFKKDLAVVTVLRDRDFKTAVKRLQGMGFDWVMLDGSGADLEEYMYDVRIYPSFILLGRDGRIAIRQCPFPSENLEKVFGKRLQDEAIISAPKN